MKAVVYEKYGSPDVLELREIEKPTPKEDEILIKVHAASVTPLDWHFLTGKPYIARLMAGPLKPKRQVFETDARNKGCYPRNRSSLQNERSSSSTGVFRRRTCSWEGY